MLKDIAVLCIYIASFLTYVAHKFMNAFDIGDELFITSLKNRSKTLNFSYNSKKSEKGNKKTYGIISL